MAEIENREQFHICVLQKPVLCKTSIFFKIEEKPRRFFSLMSNALTPWNDFYYFSAKERERGERLPLCFLAKGNLI